jgi:adenine/guanine phosphoribosyltransferase-like PRPP-binding protein
MNIMNSTIDEVRLTESGIIQGSSHTCHVLNHKIRNKIIINAVCDLRKISNEFDSIACCGVSGLMVVPQIAELLNKNIILVRKKHEKCYSDFAIEGVKPFRYIIVDDLICSGNTVRHIKRNIVSEYERSKCIGLYCDMPKECAYTIDTCKIFERDFGMPLLNPYSKQ